MPRRVVVTGLGLIAPNGNSVKTAWANMKAGTSGIGPITCFDVSSFSVRFGGEIKAFDLEKYISRKEARKMDAFIHYGMAAGIDAIEDSGLVVTEQNAGRIGASIGSGIGGLPGIEQGYGAFLEGGPRKISPFFVPSNIINMTAGNLSIRYGLKGPNYAMVTACATGAHCIGSGARLIERGDVDVMICGGAEKTTCPMGIGGFAAAKALSTRNESPQLASRPWDRDRDGFVLSDGAGIMVLEELEHARSRGAHVYAELIGFGMNADAYHMTAPSVDGDGAAQCMRLAMRDAKIEPEQVHYVNAHGTSTPAGDVAETLAMKRAFGTHAKSVAVSSTKSMIGHTLGAAGGIEAICTVLAICDQVAPPTINLDNPDPECDLDYVPNVARDMRIDIAMCNSFGFGGTNGSLIFKKF